MVEIDEAELAALRQDAARYAALKRMFFGVSSDDGRLQFTIAPHPAHGPLDSIVDRVRADATASRTEP